MNTLLDGLKLPESARWHDGRLWLANWGGGQILAVTPDGESQLIANVPTAMPLTFDWLPDGRLLIVDGPNARLLNADLSTYADLSPVASLWNEVVVDGRGNAFVNGMNDFQAPGVIAVVTPDGEVRQVADGILFGNGMAVAPDGGTLIVAESYGCRLTAFDIAEDGSLSGRRVWADLGGDHPDGICLDADGAVWYADVAAKHCVRVREGGEVLQKVESDRGCFSCTLGGEDGRSLYVLTAEWHGWENPFGDGPTGQVQVTEIG
ncbi:SMP-30/gluconolactonase/LRE family protein [Amycolatopsis roodepoortensis]|uniref:Sugar lactone lactonase YvrE n=1 Tax=Amycolatopsis roodepoortensis TaxID=700274 RepID=A0ABR9L5E7_9PSEU|nr:SMP-30/gluconolactonase/LRE family protein [Amycolatopsis roodepoortensis]MBE1575956.1 sugar lactone lactonase YvrE [Amycolatopsis roodepoortensis]